MVSTVYIGEQESLGRRVGIKVLNPKLSNNETVAKEIRRDSRNAARMSHHAISAGIDVGEIEGTACYVFEFPEGHSVEDFVIRRGPLPALSAAKIALQVAEALKYAMSKGSHHGYVSPSQVFVSSGSEATVFDIGFQTQTSLNGVLALPVGNPAFVAPEVIKGCVPDEKSDQYAIGALLYYALSGQPPMRGENWVDIASSTLTLEPQPLMTLVEDISDKLIDCVVKMMRKEPSERYDSMRDLIEALSPHAGIKDQPEELVADADVPEPIAEPEPEPSDRPRRRPRKRIPRRRG
ncbi:MAG: serine/threonine-protein kinase [Planctomycetota bacterium]|nr:serine/threonine-protein kinase [Planctomycetota bacterium]